MMATLFCKKSCTKECSFFCLISPTQRLAVSVAPGRIRKAIPGVVESRV